ncbi:MAG: PfkB family carbohydrate kinase [Pseudolabrys sp.]
MSRSTEARTILCAGGAVQDIVMRVERFPSPGAKVQASDVVTTIGGQAGNAAVTLAHLGARVRYAGPIGAPEDAVASFVQAALKREGIDCAGLIRVPGGKSSLSTIMLDRTGEKMIATRRGTKLSGVAPRDADALVEGCDAVLLDNRYPDFMGPVAAAAKAHGLPRVLDFDYGAPADDPVLLASTHVIASADALFDSTGTREAAAGLQALSSHYKGFLAVTSGPDGVTWLEGDAVRHMAAFRVEAIDTLGAGDAFHGAFTLRIAESGDIVEALRFASAVAAIKCTRFGGTTGAPTRAEVEEFLKARR